LAQDLEQLMADTGDVDSTWLIVGVCIVGTVILSYWLWVFFDCLKHESRKSSKRVPWIIVILATSIVGAALYHFVRRSTRIRHHRR
jgi:hypothetical protein